MNTKTSLLKKKLSIILFIITICSLFVVCGLRSKEGINSITTSDKSNQTSFVKVGELFDSNTKSFNKDNYKILLKYITGDANATIDTATALAETNNNSFASSGYTGTDASVFRAKTISAGTEGNTSYTAKTSSKDICVRLGGLDWQVMYLSKDKSGNTILTLWLDNNIQEAWTDRANDEGTYYGYIDGGLYSDFSANWYADNPSASFPSHMYGASYINAVTLNNGGLYATSDTASSNATQSTSSAFSLFTMPQYGLTDYLVKPRNVSWQENQSAKTILSQSYRKPNEAYATGLSNSDFYYDSSLSSYYNYSNKTYNDAWADSYLWLPSLSETGYSTSYLGLWNTSTYQRQNGDGSSTSSVGSVGTSSGYAYPCSWVRSGCSNDATYA